MTVLDLIKASLRLIGAIASSETPDSEMANDAREALNMMLQEWQNESLVSLTEQQNFSVTSGTLLYTIGPSMTWAGNKPLKILAAFLRDSSGYDHPLKIIGETEYMDLYDKDLSARPSKLFYLPSNSTGTVYLYPEPEASYTIYLMSQSAFTSYSDNDTTITLPNGYLSALKYNLAVEIAPEYETNPSQWLLKRANDTLAAIQGTNLKIPKPVRFNSPFSRGGAYDINSDTYV